MVVTFEQYNKQKRTKHTANSLFCTKLETGDYYQGLIAQDVLDDFLL